LRSILHRYHIRPPTSGLGTGVVEPWWQTLAVSSTDQLIIAQNRRLLAELDQLIQQTENELARLSASEAWIDQVTYLIQLPGVGMRSAMILLSAIGDIHRFAKAKQLVGYSGLGARIHSSGQTHRTGGITKSGRREIRTTMIEVAWNAVKHDAQWRGQFDQLASRIGRAKAIVAIARKLLVVIWHVLSKQQPDRQADPQAVARSFMRWASYHRVATSLNLKRTTFVRRELNRLGIGQTVSELRFSSRRHRLPPPETVPVAT
jgi:transposase